MSLSVEDHLEILNLYSRYSFAVDYGEAEAWADMYTADGEFVTPEAKFRGRAELVQYIVDCVRRRGTGCRHYPSNIVIEGDRGQASGRAYLTFVPKKTTQEENPVAYFFRYEDRLVRTPAGWRFQQRKVIAD